MTMNEARQAGDMSAAQLFREHGAFVARFLYRLGVPPQAIDDAVQEVFLVVHQRGGYRPGPAKPTTYLALIASRAASAQRRQQRLRAARQGSTQPEEIHAQQDDPARWFERRDELSRLQDALERLDPALRETLLLAEFEDETAPAIAHAMGVSVGTVYWRLHEARKRFQRALAVTDGRRAQAAAKRLPARRRASQVLVRAAKLSAIFGLFGRSQARALFQAARDTPYDVASGDGLQRHLERVAELPAPQLSFGAKTGVLKAGAWAGAAAIGAFTAFQVLQRVPAAAPASHAAQSAHVAPASQAPIVGSAAAARVAEPTHTASASPPERALEAALPDGELARHARARGSAPRSRADGRARELGQRASSSASADAPPAATGWAASLAGSSGEPAVADVRQLPAETAPPPSAAQAPAATANPQPAQHASIEDSDPLFEARAVARADRLLATQPAQALAILEGLPPNSAHQYLSEERQYVQVMALYGVGRRSEAQGAADRFLTRYPSSVFRERVSTARKAAALP